jgi:hypothetical protein
MSEGRKIMTDWVLEAIRAHGGQAEIIEICKHVWQMHEAEIREQGDLLYEWQYEIRWAGNILRSEGALLPANQSTRGVWELCSSTSHSSSPK